MIVGQGQLIELLTSIHPSKLSSVDAETIVELAQLTLDADGREDADEIKTFFAVARAVFGLAGMRDTAPPTFVSDDEDNERMVALAGKLSTPAAKELAFACAHLLSICDVAIAPEEAAFVSNLRDALAMSIDRAGTMMEQINTAITPHA